jgi:MFS family permease
VSRLRSPLLPIFLIVLVDVLGFTIVIPLLAYYAEHFGASPLVATTLVSVYAVCSLISTPVIGNLSDRYGRKPLLLISQGGTCAGFLVLAYSSSLWMVFVGRILDGITAGNLSTAQAYISDVTEPKNRAKAFGVIGVAFGLGFMVGPAIGAELGKHGLHYPFMLSAGLSALSMLATSALLPGGKPPQKQPAAGALPGGKRPSAFAFRTYVEYFRRPGLASLYAQFFLFTFAFSCFTSGFALFAERRFYAERDLTRIGATCSFTPEMDIDVRTVRSDYVIAGGKQLEPDAWALPASSIELENDTCKALSPTSRITAQTRLTAGVAEREVARIGTSCMFALRPALDLRNEQVVTVVADRKPLDSKQWTVSNPTVELAAPACATLSETSSASIHVPWGVREVGLLFTFTGLLGIILQGGLIGRLVKRFGEVKLSIAGFVAVIIGYSALGMTYTLSGLLVIAVFNSFGNGVLRPCVTSRITQTVAGYEQGIALGISGSLSSLAMALAPPTGGVLLDGGRTLAWALVPALVAVLGLVATVATRPRSTPEAAELSSRA